MLADESLHVLRLVARCVVGEEDDPPRSPPLRVLNEIGQVELVLPAPPLWVGVEDESFVLLRPEERDERVPAFVVSWR